MAAWIRFDADLLTDPKVAGLSARLAALDPSMGSRSALVAVGALVKLWCLAAVHVNNENIVDCGADDIDQLVGIVGFCQLMPRDWLQVLDANHVYLPEFSAHDGATSARKRIKKVDRATLDSFKPESIAGLDAVAWKRWREYRNSNHPLKGMSIEAAARQLAKYGDSQAAVVEQSIANQWRGLFDLKQLGGKGGFVKSIMPPQSRDLDAWASLAARARVVGFRLPYEHESLNNYRLGVENLERPKGTRSRAEIMALAEKMKVKT